MTRMVSAVFALVLAAAPVFAQQPRFQSGVDLIPVDVTVVDGGGRPIDDLAPGDFTVRVDDQTRRVVSAQWIPRLTAATANPDGASSSLAADGYFSNASAAGSGLVVIAIDEANIKFGGMRPMLPAVTRFIDRLPPADRIAIVSFGQGRSSWSDFTADRGIIKEKLAQMPGQIAAPENPWSYRVGIGAALAFRRGDPEALVEVIRRTCAGTQVQRIPADYCPEQVRLEAARVADLALRNADLTINGLRDLLTVLKTVDAPKTLLLISDGFGLDRSVVQRRVVDVADLAAAARTTIYGLKLEEEAVSVTETVQRSPFEIQQDQVERRQGLELLAYAARGGLFTLSGSGTGAFDRIETEMSGYYLLGVDATGRDREGPSKALQVTVARPDATVRARRAMAIDPRAAPQTAHDRANAALGNPLMLSAVPLRGTAVALRGPDRSKVQVLVHADIEAPRSGSRVVSVAYVILDDKKRAVDGQITDLRIDAAKEAPLRYSRTALVDPGLYTIRIAVADGDLTGSVEFPIRAEVMRAGTLEVTDLVVGGPEPASNPSQPSLGPEVRFGLLQGYLEAYGAEAADLTATFEVVQADDGPALLSASVPARRGGDERFIFSKVQPVAELPPGIYRLRSTLAGRPLVKSRPFELVATPAAAGGALFLTVSAADLSRPFDLDSALQPDLVRALRARPLEPATAEFDQALAHLRNRAYVEAAALFERTIDAGGSRSAALAYLGVCFAAAGHDDEAVAVWRKAFADGADAPDVHAWVIDALLRTKRYGEGRAATEAALARWPADARFARPLALLRATAGNAREAVLALDRYLEQPRNDEASLFLALTWIFEAKRAGLAIRESREQVRLARSYAAQYAALNGARQPLVGLWIGYLDQ